MDQTLAETKLNTRNRPELRKKNTQESKIVEIWGGLTKTEWKNETDEYKKTVLKGELYTQIQQIFEEKFATKLKRSTIRRCVNSFIKQAK